MNIGGNDDNGLERFHSVAAIAEALDVDERTVYRWVDARELIAHRVGRQLRISKTDLDAFLNERRNG